MTIDLFLSRHEKEWQQIRTDLIALVDKQNPAWQADKLDLKTMAESNATFTATIAGFAHARNFLTKIGEGLSQEPEETATFTTPPNEVNTPGAMPVMPAPKERKK
jgi:hypothetical protein